MKKLFLPVLMLASFASFSQSNYFGVSVGYGFGVPGVSVEEYDTDTSFGGTASVKNLNIGGGINTAISYGILLAENLSLDLAIGYQNNLGSTYEERSYDGQASQGGVIWVEEVRTFTINTSSFRFAPSLRFAAGNGSIRPFAKVGPQVILASMKTKDEMQSGSASMLTEEKFSISVSVGALAAVGVEFEIADNLMFFATFDASLGYYAPTKSEVVTYEIDGQDMLGQLDTRNKETEYEKERTFGVGQSDPDEPITRSRMRIDYSSLGLSVGIRMLL